jgi:hypothetical protein
MFEAENAFRKQDVRSYDKNFSDIFSQIVQLNFNKEIPERWNSKMLDLRFSQLKLRKLQSYGIYRHAVRVVCLAACWMLVSCLADFLNYSKLEKEKVYFEKREIPFCSVNCRIYK